MSRTVVRFVRSYDRYNSGEVAGFDANKAQELVQAGIAVMANAGKPKLSRKPIGKSEDKDNGKDEGKDEGKKTLKRPVGTKKAVNRMVSTGDGDDKGGDDKGVKSDDSDK